MPKRNPNQKPGFAWQGALILLPVIVLALVSLIALRQDERAAELDLRNRAAENAQSLARAVRSSVNDELSRFFALEDELTIFSRSPPDAAGLALGAHFRADADKWEHDYPEIKLSDMITETADILTDGSQLRPPERDAVPTPPQWFLDLAPLKKDQWRDLRSATSLAEINSRKQAFLADNPSPVARLAASYVTRAADQYSLDSRPLATETGISFLDVACCRALTATNARLSEAVLNSVWLDVIENPSFVAKRLIEMTAKLTNQAAPDIRQKFSWLEFVWNEQSRSSRWLEPIRRLPELRHWQGPCMSHWTDGGEALAVIAPIESVSPQVAFQNPPQQRGADQPDRLNENGINPLDRIRRNGRMGLIEGRSGLGYLVSFVPSPVLAAIFNKALADNKFMVPEYASAALSVEGKPLLPLSATARDAKDLLGHAEQTAGNDSVTKDAIHFDLKMFLTNKEQMLSAGRRRARLFGGLVLGAVFAAVAGLVSARRAFDRQLRLNEMKSNFVSSVSHELRSPIASVRLMAENLERGKIPEAPRQREYFRFIMQECRRLSSLIENVLDFSRIEQGRKQYDLEPTNMIAVTQTTVKLMEPSAAEKEVTLEMAVPPAANPIELNVDGRAIQQALVNLIDNAIKHSPKGQTVTVALEINGAVLRLSVSDHGPGIPPAEHEKIFERFYRLGSELRRETQGVGIGLSVVKHIVTAHDGRIIVQSAPGKGSRFTIELPVRNQHE
jgi:signal transduction histidine kinase